jgi:hypothetical protein
MRSFFLCGKSGKRGTERARAPQNRTQSSAEDFADPILFFVPIHALLMHTSGGQRAALLITAPQNRTQSSAKNLADLISPLAQTCRALPPLGPDEPIVVDPRVDPEDLQLRPRPHNRATPTTRQRP